MWQRPNWIRVSSICRRFFLAIQLFSASSVLYVKCGHGHVQSKHIRSEEWGKRDVGWIWMLRKLVRKEFSRIEPIQWIIQAIAFNFLLTQQNKNKRVHTNNNSKILFTISNVSRNFKSPVRNGVEWKKSTTRTSHAYSYSAKFNFIVFSLTCHWNYTGKKGAQLRNPNHVFTQSFHLVFILLSRRNSQISSFFWVCLNGLRWEMWAHFTAWNISGALHSISCLEFSVNHRRWCEGTVGE